MQIQELLPVGRPTLSNESPTRGVRFNAPEDLMEDFKRVAESQNPNVSALIRKLMDQHLRWHASVSAARMARQSKQDRKARRRA